MRKLILALATTTLATACGSSTKLSLSTRAGSATAPAARASALTAGPGVDVTRVRMIVDSIRFEAVGSTDGGTSSSDQDEVVAGPYLIDLSGPGLAGGISQVFEVDARAGTYKDVRFRIHRLEEGSTQFTGMAGLSVSIEGTIDGSPFTFTSSLNEEQRRDTTFQVAADVANNVTLAIDPAAWFAAGGALLDPRVEANRPQIESNIKGSIDAFDDDDRNGHRD